MSDMVHPGNEVCEPIARCRKCGRTFITVNENMIDPYLVWATVKERGPVCGGKIEMLPEVAFTAPTPAADRGEG